MLRGEIWGLQKTGCEQAGLTDPIGQENHPWGSVAGVSVLQIKQRRKKTQCEWKKCGWFPVPCLLQWDSSNSDISAKKTKNLECRSREQPYFSCDSSLCAWPPRQLRNSRHSFLSYKKSWSGTARARKTNRGVICPPVEDMGKARRGSCSIQLLKHHQGRRVVGHGRNSRLDLTHQNVVCNMSQCTPPPPTLPV